MELTIVPVAHLSSKSVELVRETILAVRPDFIAIELDRSRLEALMTGKRPRMRDSLRSPFFFMLYLLQQALGRVFAIKPGSEQLEAVKLAREHKITLVLIDITGQQIAMGFKRIPFKEKLGLFLEAPKSLFRPKKKFDMDKITSEEFLEKFMAEFKEKFPVTYDTIVTQRNEHMARALMQLDLNNPGKKVVAVLGAGHVAGIRSILEHVEPLQGNVSIKVNVVHT
ncbi:TraB family protein [Candidatus Gugararchaeum adminiculabundum]|nr:TraB family protein [Candidatus Gugararchaeum adminiculabundum]